MNNSLVIIPTHNERSNVYGVISSVLEHGRFDILVVDDASSDGTVQVVREIMVANKHVYLIERQGKYGLGTAYITGFTWGLERGYKYFIEMDADGSHNPDDLPRFIKGIDDNYDLVIGSRYIDGKINVVGWDFKRLLLSKFGNLYAAKLLGLKLTDLTSGFRCYSRKAFAVLDLDHIHSNGYSFQIELAYLVSEAGLKIHEIPIIFFERTSGPSKMSKRIVWEAVMLPWKLNLLRIIKYLRGV